MKCLTEYDCRKVLKDAGICVPNAYLVKTKAEAVEIAHKIGFPVVMKLVSKDILHKSDAGGVVTGISCDDDVLREFEIIINNAKKYKSDAKIDGVLLEETLSGREVIVGVAHDPQFGPVIMFGIGGIFVEVLHDVVFRIVPLEKKDAREMICEIKGHKILKGVRGEEPVNIKAIEDVLLKISKLVWKEKNIYELDINPLFVDSKGAVAGDARIILSG